MSLFFFYKKTCGRKQVIFSFCFLSIWNYFFAFYRWYFLSCFFLNGILPCHLLFLNGNIPIVNFRSIIFCFCISLLYLSPIFPDSALLIFFLFFLHILYCFYLRDFFLFNRLISRIRINIFFRNGFCLRYNTFRNFFYQTTQIFIDSDFFWQWSMECSLFFIWWGIAFFLHF